MSPFNEYLEALASSSPTPGGGSAACYSAAQGVALLAMVCELSKDKKKLSPFRDQHLNDLKLLGSARKEFLALAEADERAFQKVMAVYKTGGAELQTELKNAAGVALSVLEKCDQLWGLCLSQPERANPHAVSDTFCGFYNLQAGFLAARVTVVINLVALEEGDDKKALAAKLKDLTSRYEEVKGEMNLKEESQFGIDSSI